MRPHRWFTLWRIYITRTRRRFHRLLADPFELPPKALPQVRLIERKQNLRVIGMT